MDNRAYFHLESACLALRPEMYMGILNLKYIVLHT